MAQPDGRVGEEGQQQHHQGHPHHVLGGQKHQVSEDPTSYDVSQIVLQLLMLAGFLTKVHAT